jgi:hypothetical protein
MKQVKFKAKIGLLNLFLLAVSMQLFAQRDIIYKIDSSQIRCKILKVTTDKYEYAFADSANKVFK